MLDANNDFVDYSLTQNEEAREMGFLYEVPERIISSAFENNVGSLLGDIEANLLTVISPQTGGAHTLSRLDSIIGKDEGIQYFAIRTDSYNEDGTKADQVRILESDLGELEKSLFKVGRAKNLFNPVIKSTKLISLNKIPVLTDDVLDTCDTTRRLLEYFRDETSIPISKMMGVFDMFKIIPDNSDYNIERRELQDENLQFMAEKGYSFYVGVGATGWCAGLGADSGMDGFGDKLRNSNSLLFKNAGQYTLTPKIPHFERLDSGLYVPK